MDRCVFCRIVEGAAPASLVYSDARVMAFLDVQPVNPGHVLIVPREHARGLSDLDPEVGCQMLKVAMIVAGGLKNSGLKCEGTSLYLADGESAFQEIFHIHMHVIPRFRGDGFGLKLGPDYGRKPERKELDLIAERIRNAINK